MVAGVQVFLSALAEEYLFPLVVERGGRRFSADWETGAKALQPIIDRAGGGLGELRL